MAKTFDIAKKIKIDKAQQNMFVAVTIASFILGACLVVSVYFLKYIRFDSAVISEKEKAIQGYSDSIKNIGVCVKPKGKVYNSTELSNCKPNDIDPDEVPGSLRYNVLVDMASNENLESVGRNDLSVCVDSKTGERMSYDKLLRKFKNSTTEEDRLMNYEIYTMCSALRAIPDALPASKNELALMASVDKIFKISGWEPNSIVPGDAVDGGAGSLGTIGVTLGMETTSEMAIRVLRNVERSIREIDMQKIGLEWVGSGLNLTATGSAYYIDTAKIDEGMVTVKGDGKVTRSAGAENEDI